MLTYLLQMIACSGILYGYYHFFLRNERFHQYNRFYLLFSVVLSLLLPLIKIPVLLKAEESPNPIYLFVSSGEDIVITAKEKFDASSLIYILYGLVVLFLLTRLLLTIKKIISIKRSSVTEQIEDIQFINTAHDDAPFSFFKWLFWNSKTSLQSAEGEQIFKHEMYHIRSKHSWDLLFAEIVLAVFWFNPFFYLYRKELKAIQEFLADKYAAEGYDATSYAELLLLQALGSHQRPLVNPFFHTQLKRRIAMLLSSKKPQHQWLRKLLVLPIAAVVIALFGFTYKKEIKNLITHDTQKPVVRNSLADIISSNKMDSSIKDTVPKKNKHTDIKSSYNDDDEIFSPVLKSVSVVSYSSDPGTTNQDNDKKEEVYTLVNVDAAYPGGSEAWRELLMQNLNTDVPVKNGAPIGNYHVFVQFTIDKNGVVSDVKALTHLGYGMEEEAIRTIKLSEKWHPAIMNGTAQKSYRKQPIIFHVLPKEKAGTATGDSGSSENKTQNVTTYSKEPEIFSKVEVDAVYPGNWRSYLERNLNGSVPVDNGVKPGNYTTIIQFIVDKDGNTSDFKALTHHGYGMEEEALRVVKASGKWKPAVQNGREVKAFRKQPITFQIVEVRKK